LLFVALGVSIVDVVNDNVTELELTYPRPPLAFAVVGAIVDPVIEIDDVPELVRAKIPPLPVEVDTDDVTVIVVKVIV
jgi:hypothetical protein